MIKIKNVPLKKFFTIKAKTKE